MPRVIEYEKKNSSLCHGRRPSRGLDIPQFSSIFVNRVRRENRETLLQRQYERSRPRFNPKNHRRSRLCSIAHYSYQIRGDLAVGKTVPSYRMALEFEIQRWKSFRKALKCEEDVEAFDQLMDMCRSHASAASNATNPIILEPMIMSILLAQQKKLQKLEYTLNDLIWQKNLCLPSTEDFK